MQLVTLVSFLTAGLHWRNRWTNSVNLHTWRWGGSVQCDSIFLLKPPKLSFPQVILDKIQRLSSARLIFKVPRSARITPFLYDLHWLPIIRRIKNKIAHICFHIVSGTALLYLSELLHLYSPSRSLRSAADTRIFRVPRMGRRALGERSFHCIGPVLWNSLPLSIRHSSLLSSFKSKLKTHLFSSAYCSVVLPIHHQ